MVLTSQIPEPAEDQLGNIMHLLYQFEQTCHKFRVEALSEQQLTKKLATEKYAAAKCLTALITQQQLALLDRLQKNGHGGGNWRRLIEFERSRLQ